MKLGLMQPYLFPYLGYFQLIYDCDLFLLHDDVQYIKGGWINRNRILVNGEPHWFTLPVSQGPSTARINERTFAADFADEKRRVLRELTAAYRKAPLFEETIDLIGRCFAFEANNVAAFLTHSLSETCRHLGIDTPIRRTSEMEKDDSLAGEERVLDINLRFGSTWYVNPSGGSELYDTDRFAARGIKLSFLHSLPTDYPQFGGNFVPWLSIIDVMMFNSRDRIGDLLTRYELK